MCFLFSSSDGVAGVIRMSHQRENHLWSEVLKGARVEDEVEHEGEILTLKQVLKNGNQSKKDVCGC